jgi:hypothetical protein
MLLSYACTVTKPNLYLTMITICARFSFFALTVASWLHENGRSTSYMKLSILNGSWLDQMLAFILIPSCPVDIRLYALRIFDQILSRE